MTVAAAPVAARVAAPVAARAGSGKVIEGQVVSSRAAGVTGRNTRTVGGGGRSADAAGGAGLGQLLSERSSSVTSRSHGRRAAPRQLLVAEFIVCMVILALSPVTDKHKDEGAQAFLRRAAAICALFFLLALLSAGGRGPARVAAAFGGLVTLALLVSNRSIFVFLAEKFNSGRDGPPGPPGDDEYEAGPPSAGPGGRFGAPG
jgi:hypothetical protein